MRKDLTFKWLVSWQYVDRRQMFDALQGNEVWRNAAIDSMQPIDDHDPDTVSCGVAVETLDELRDLLNATASITTPWGYALCLTAGDGERTRIHASLATGKEFASGAAMYVQPPKEGENSLYDKLAAVSRSLHEAMKEL